VSKRERNVVQAAVQAVIKQAAKADVTARKKYLGAGRNTS
jgi:hypothetical protein